MTNQDKIAAATLAQIFGSELLKVDEATTQQSNMTGPAVKMHPRQFLNGTDRDPAVNLREDERRILEAVNREAEMSYPRQEEPQQEAPVRVTAPLQQTISPIGASVIPQVPVDQNQMEFSFPPPGSPGFELFVSINKNLERIAKAIESFELPKESSSYKKSSKSE